MPTSPQTRSLLRHATVVVCLAACAAPAGAAQAGPTGEQIYRKRCAACHGKRGEGTPDHYKRPLAGDRSVEQLARLIARTMPKDDPEPCRGEDARQVAAYIYDAFYSPAARARSRPPRVELSRLTVRQYRNAVADLVGSFRAPGKWDAARGLRAAYFQTGRRRDTSLPGRFERIDPEVRFDFGTASPDPTKLAADRFGVRWEGGVLAPETGEYEFIVRTDHAAKLWVNDPKRPLIDAGVKSGNGTEYRGTVPLLGGRVYPMRLEFFKGRLGDPDNKKKEAPPPPVKASVVLEWKRPHQAAEVVPSGNLSPNHFPAVFVPTTPFPADDRSEGYERGTSVSKAWEQAVTDAAVETAAYVTAHLGELAGVGDGARDRAPRLRDFCRRLAERAFRRPLTAEQQRLIVDRRFDQVRDPEAAVKRVVLFVLLSPQFLYQLGPGDAYDTAARLSFGLWDSLPDDGLRQAAATGRLATREQVLAQARRMAGDLRARAKLREFFFQWLKVDQVPDLAKDPKRYPGFDAAVASDLRTSLGLFVDDVLWSGSSDFRQLLLADETYLNGRLARFYGVNLAADASFQKVRLDPGRRAGVLTHPYLMAAFAYTGDSSPIHRGVLVARNLLGRVLQPPPEAFAPLAAELHPDLTTRERVALQTRPQQCEACHGVINPLGYTMEQFDAVGRYRERERGKPIDATGLYQTPAGDVVRFAGVRALAAYLAGSDESHEAFVERLFHHLVKQPVQAYGVRQLAELNRAFAANRYNMRELAVEIVAETALAGRLPVAAGPRGGRVAGR